MANPKVYIHELVDIIGQNRAKYMHHMTANWAPLAAERGMGCLGVWATVGSTGRWPQTVNVWELDGWGHMAANFRRELSHPTHQDPALARWWAEAAQYRSGGLDRVLVPAPYSPTVAEALAQGRGGQVYYHELVSVAPGRARAFLDQVGQEWLAVAGDLGMVLVGAWRTAMVNDSEAVLIWSLADWDAWGRAQAALDAPDPQVARWRQRTEGLALDWRGTLMVPAPLCPLNTGRPL
ncbi:MAG TPA: hypothetical protein VKY15_02610 [Acidimicrobiales bacterium]|nr:hypothetical protein [Acidimicrobiales bacterium]